MQVNKENGLNIYTRSVSDYSTTESWFDSENYGVTTKTHTLSNYGVGYARESWVNNMEVNLWTGQNKWTDSTGAYSDTHTEYKDDTTGVAKSSRTTNHYGLSASRESHINEGEMWVNEFNGLNMLTISHSDYADTMTVYDWENYGTTTSSITMNHYGIGATRTSWISPGNIQVNTDNGMNEWTINESFYATTTTHYGTDSYGLPLTTDTVNNYGTGKTRHSWSNAGDLVQDTNTGMNIFSISHSDFGDTFTYFAEYYDPQDTYGTVKKTVSLNHYGIMFTRQTTTSVDASNVNGLNQSTTADTDFGHTVTTFTNDTYGVVDTIDTNNKYGMGWSQHTWSNSGDVSVDTWTGMTWSTTTHSLMSDSTTYNTNYFDPSDTYGIAYETITSSKVGAVAERDSITINDPDYQTGQNKTSTTWCGLLVNGNLEGISRETTTTFDTDTGGAYGIAVSSVTTAKYGAFDSLVTNTAITSDPNTGQNIETTADNGVSTVHSWRATEDDYIHGGMSRSQTTSKHAARYATNSESMTDIDYDTGLNKSTYTLTGEAGHYYSETQSTYNTGDLTGSMNTSTTTLNAGLCFTNTQVTTTTNWNNDYNICTYSESTNDAGQTQTHNDENGLMVWSYNYSRMGHDRTNLDLCGLLVHLGRNRSDRILFLFTGNARRHRRRVHVQNHHQEQLHQRLGELYRYHQRLWGLGGVGDYNR